MYAAALKHVFMWHEYQQANLCMSYKDPFGGILAGPIKSGEEAEEHIPFTRTQ